MQIFKCAWGWSEPLTLHVVQGSTVYIFQFFKILFIYFIIYFWLHWVFIAAHGLSVVAASRGYSVVVCGLLIAMASLVEEHQL